MTGFFFIKRKFTFQSVGTFKVHIFRWIFMNSSWWMEFSYLCFSMCLPFYKPNLELYSWEIVVSWYMLKYLKRNLNFKLLNNYWKLSLFSLSWWHLAVLCCCNIEKILCRITNRNAFGIYFKTIDYPITM